MNERLKERQKPIIGFKRAFFNKPYGDFNGDKIIPQEETIHNPIPARTMPVTVVKNMTLKEEVAIGASIEL